MYIIVALSTNFQHYCRTKSIFNQVTQSSIPIKRLSSSPSQSWTKSVFNSHEEAFVDFRQFLTDYKTWWHSYHYHWQNHEILIKPTLVKFNFESAHFYRQNWQSWMPLLVSCNWAQWISWEWEFHFLYSNWNIHHLKTFEKGRNNEKE